MGDSRFDSQPFLGQKEGQHFERKSMWHGPAGKKRPRDCQKVREEATEKATTPFHPFLAQAADAEEVEAAGADGGKLDPGSQALPEDLLTAIDQLGSRPRKESVRGMIRAICAVKPWTTREEIAKHLRFSQKKPGPKHLTPMVDAGWLELRYPQQPTHPHQAYGSTPASHGDRQPEGT